MKVRHTETIADEYCREPAEHENEVTLSELAGLLSAKLDDAMARGLISFGESSTTLDGSTELYEPQTNGNDVLHI